MIQVTHMARPGPGSRFPGLRVWVYCLAYRWLIKMKWLDLCIAFGRTKYEKLTLSYGLSLAGNA